MSTACTADPSPLTEFTAIVMGLVAMSVGTVTLIGGTGMMMWVFGL